MSFESFELNPRLLEAINALGFDEPTSIQLVAIPPAMAGQDLLACAGAGSGRTAALLLPMLHRLLDGVKVEPRRPRALVLTPTPERAARLGTHLEGLARFTEIGARILDSAAVMVSPERALRDGVDVLVATPRRLLDHLGHFSASLDTIEVLVLEGADRMLDPGFLPDVQRILGLLPEKRQTLLLSATTPPELAELARRMLHQPVTIDLAAPAPPASGVRLASGNGNGNGTAPDAVSPPVRRRGEDEVNGNVPGTHEQSHLEFLNQEPENQNGNRRRSRRGAKRKAKGKAKDNGDPAATKAASSSGRSRRKMRTPPSTFRDDDVNPVIPPDFDLPPRESGRPPRASHQPAALSESGRRYLVGPDEDET